MYFMEVKILELIDSCLIFKFGDGYKRYNAKYDIKMQELLGLNENESLIVNMTKFEPKSQSAPFEHLTTNVSTKRILNGKVDTQFDQKVLMLIMNLSWEHIPAENEIRSLYQAYNTEKALILICPHQNPLEYLIFNGKYEVFFDSLIESIINQKLKPEFIKNNKQKIHNFFKSQVDTKYKLIVFKNVSADSDFYDYKFVKPFRLQNGYVKNDLKSICKYITSRNRNDALLDKNELQLLIFSTMNKTATWQIEQHETRGLIGIICSYINEQPFDRLNGNFENDRIVLYTYFIMGKGEQLFKDLLKGNNYMVLSILNDLPGFGSFFTPEQKSATFNLLKEFISEPVKKSAKIEQLQQGDINQYLEKYEFDLPEYKYVKFTLDTLKNWSANPQMSEIRSSAKLVDALLHSSQAPQIYEFCAVCIVIWFNYIYNYMSTEKIITIKDLVRISSTILGFFQIFSSINDANMIQILSIYILAMYNLSQDLIFSKTKFIELDTSLPLNFEGDQAILAYINDQYECRTNTDQHIIASPGDLHIFSSSQLLQLQQAQRKQSESKNDNQPKSEMCDACKQSLALILKKLILINQQESTYYFDSCITKRKCEQCSNHYYFLSDEEEITNIAKRQPVYKMQREFPSSSIFKNNITSYLNMDNSIQQLKKQQSLSIPLKQTIMDLKTHRQNVKNLHNFDSKMIYQLNDVQDVIQFLKQDVDTLNFEKAGDLIQVKESLDKEMCVDAFMEPSTQPQSQPKITSKSQKSLTSLAKMCEDADHIKNSDVDNEPIPLRVYVTNKITIEAGLISVLRACFASENNIQVLAEHPEKFRNYSSQSAYLVFYKNEHTLGLPIGLPSKYSIFNNGQLIESHNCKLLPQLEQLLVNNFRNKKFVQNFQTTFNSSQLKYVNQMSNDTKLLMLLSLYQKFSIDYLAQIHATNFYQNTVCQLISSVQLDQSDMSKQIIQQLQYAINDFSNEPFSSHWFVDSFQGERNRGVLYYLGNKCESRIQSWPEQFDVDFQYESFTSTGLNYIPAFLRYLKRVRMILFDDEQAQFQLLNVKTIYYQFQQLQCLSKVVTLKRLVTSKASLQALTVNSLLKNPELLRKLILNQDSQGNMSVKHLSMDTIQILLNNGELDIICQWITNIYDGLLKYLYAKIEQETYQGFVKQLINPPDPNVTKQYFLKQKLPEYYTHSFAQTIMSLDSAFTAIAESNSIMTAPVFAKVATISRSLTGDPLFAQLQAKALIQLKVLLGMQIQSRQQSIIETITFNNRRLIPLVTNVRLVKQVQLMLDMHFLVSRINVNKMDVVTSLGFEKQYCSVDFIKGLLASKQIFIPISLQGHSYDKAKQKICEVIMDANALENKAVKCNFIVADRQIYVYGGKNSETYVGMITLVGAAVCKTEFRKQKMILISTQYPRVRNYAILANDELDDLFIAIATAAM